jgi:EAL domain-containing protein (putative c-di-GMP-specific phosphodiesterase class I)
LLKNADAAMYRAKSQGNAYQFFAPKTQERIVDRRASVLELHRAMERRELVVRYHPCVALTTRHLVGGQAHVQWCRQAGVVPPPELLRLAQEAGLLTSITQWLLHTACADACAWQSPGAAPIVVGVPVSRPQFAQESFIDSVHRALCDSGLDPHCLDLELDEGVFLLESGSTAGKLRALHGLGLTLSIADFGTGYSPLGDLTQFAIDGLRVGPDLVGRLMRDPDSAAIVRGIIAMARELKMSVVAEGVESEAQADWLQAHGCDMIQGDLVAGPLFAEAFQRMLDGGEGAGRRAA